MVAPFAGTIDDGAVGRVVSIVKLLMSEKPLVLPARSVTVTFMVCKPSASALPGLYDQLPEALVVAVPIGAPSRYTATVLLGSAVPVKVGGLLLVLAPLAGVTARAAAGALVSIVKVLVLEKPPVLPAASVDLA